MVVRKGKKARKLRRHEIAAERRLKKQGREVTPETIRAAAQRTIKKQAPTTRIEKKKEIAPTKAEPVIKKAEVRPTIELGKKETASERQARQREFVGKLITGKAADEEIKGELGKFIKGLGIAATIGAVVSGGAAGLGAMVAKKVGMAVITRTALRRGGSIVTQRAFVGKSGKFALDKVFHAVRPVAARFATNPKTIGSSISMLSKIGLTLGAASLAVGALGSYPFAGFIKEEAVQTLNIGIFKAVDAGDDEGAQKLIDEVDEILEAEGSIMSKIPYANVLSSLKTFFDATRETNEEWKRIIAIRKAEISGEEETEFARERRESDEAARQRKLEAMEFDARYYALIREGKFDEANELLEEQLKGGA